LLEQYLQSLLDAVEASRLVRASSVTLDRRTLYAGVVRGDVYFADGSHLHFRELVESNAEIERQMYAYHYQDASGALVFRDDDTPHHPALEGYPHHKHVGDETIVTPAEPPQLSTVLQEIERSYRLD
jgi:hypothetical protein